MSVLPMVEGAMNGIDSFPMGVVLMDDAETKSVESCLFLDLDLEFDLRLFLDLR